MIPIVAGLVSMLANKGLDLISSAIDGGAEKAKEYIEEKTGIELDKGLTEEQVAELKKFEMTHALELKKLALADKQEDNRHEEASIQNVLLDKQSARGAADVLGPVQTSIADKIYTQSAWTIPALLVLNALLIAFAVPLQLDTTAVVAIGNLIGIALNNSYRERQSVIEFLFGSSVGKKDK